MDKLKVNKDEFLNRVLTRLQNGVPRSQMVSRGSARLFSVPEMYDAMIDEIFDIVRSGDRLSLTGFGSFFSQTHKGHPVQFGSDKGLVEDYSVFKFSPSNVLNRDLRRGYREKDAKDEAKDRESDEADES